MVHNSFTVLEESTPSGYSEPSSSPNPLSPENNNNTNNNNQTSPEPTKKGKKAKKSLTAAEAEEEKKAKTTQKRAEQNRQAQKTFRERKMKYVRDLEDKLTQVTEQSRQVDMLKMENSELRSLVTSLQSENKKLKDKFNFVPDIRPSMFQFATSTTTTATTTPVPIPAHTPTQKYSDVANVVFNDYFAPNILSMIHQNNNSNNNLSPLLNYGLLNLTGVPNVNESITTPISDTQISVPLTTSTTTTITQTPSQIRDDEEEEIAKITQNLSSPSTSSSNLFSPSNNQNDYLLFDSSLSTPSLSSDPSSPPQVSEIPILTETERLLPTTPADWSAFLTEDANKRSIDESSLYGPPQVSAGAANGCFPLPIIFSRDHNFEGVEDENELCELLKNVYCHDRNPELCHGVKFMKSM